MGGNKKVTKRLDSQELEKRKAPFASPITYREGEGETGGGGLEPPEQQRTERPEVEKNLPKAPRVHRHI